MVRKRQGKERSLFSRIAFGVAAVFLAALLMLSYLSMWINPAWAWYMSVFSLAYLPVLFCCGALIVWGIFRRAWWPVVLLVLVMIPSIILIGRYFQFNGHPADGSRGDIKLVSYNVGRFVHGQGEFERLSQVELSEEVANYLAGTDADVICLQEFYLPTGTQPGAWLKRHFPGYTPEYYIYTGEKGRFGNVILSRFPVVDKGKITFEESTNMALFTDLNVRGTKIRVYNCHFESYNISLSHLARSIREDGAKGDGRKFRRANKIRPAQVDKVMANIDACSEPAIVVGDFNDTPLSYTYTRLSRDRKDSFLEVGKGFGATYSSLWPMLRIDYILYPKTLEARWYDRGDVKYSDHYPILSSFLQ